MDERPVDPSRIRTFIEKKITELKEELEYYEYILELLGEGDDLESKKGEKLAEDELVLGGKTVAIFIKKGSELYAKLLKPIQPDILRIDNLRQKISLVVPFNFSLDMERDEVGHITAIKVGNLKNPSSIDATIKIIKKHLTSVYK